MARWSRVGRRCSGSSPRSSSVTARKPSSCSGTSRSCGRSPRTRTPSTPTGSRVSTTAANIGSQRQCARCSDARPRWSPISARTVIGGRMRRSTAACASSSPATAGASSTPMRRRASDSRSSRSAATARSPLPAGSARRRRRSISPRAWDRRSRQRAWCCGRRRLPRGTDAALPPSFIGPKAVGVDHAMVGSVRFDPNRLRRRRLRNEDAAATEAEPSRRLGGMA